jgi:hypothetical protein
MITIFSAPKPFIGHIDVIQRNAIQSWQELGRDIEVLLIGEEEGLREVAAEYGTQHIPDVARNELGTPIVSSIFQLARQRAQYSTLCYVNADIIILDDFLSVVRNVEATFDSFLVIGQRWDMAITERIRFKENWQGVLRKDLEVRGRIHPPAGSDYFVYKRGSFQHMPSFALGRAGWDNWMIFAGRAGSIPVIDATRSITIVHQDHDYAHLPDEQPHYRLPESDENVRLSGGKETIFTLTDANWFYADGQVERKSWTERWSRRGLETSVIARFGPGRLSRSFCMVFHPIDTLTYYWKAFLKRVLRSSETNLEMGQGRE